MFKIRHKEDYRRTCQSLTLYYVSTNTVSDDAGDQQRRFGGCINQFIIMVLTDTSRNNVVITGEKPASIVSFEKVLKVKYFTETSDFFMKPLHFNRFSYNLCKQFASRNSPGGCRSYSM